MAPILKIKYNQKPEYRAKRILDMLGITEDFPGYDKMLEETSREFVLDRGRGVNFQLYDEELARAKISWDIMVKKYTAQIMAINSFRCLLCNNPIREQGKIKEHQEWCAFRNYSVDFISDLLD